MTIVKINQLAVPDGQHAELIDAVLVARRR